MPLEIKENIVLSPFTTFKIGGPSKFFSAVSKKEDLIYLTKWAKDKMMPIFVLGGGSNILVSDKGFDGLTVKIQFAGDIKIGDSKIFCGAGASFAKLINESAAKELTGLEWGVGIPGTLGGAINGNAGAYGESISNAVENVEVFNVNNLKFENFDNEKCKFGYRDSIFKKDPEFIIISAVLNLKKGNKESINNLIKDAIKKRVDSHGVGMKSAGCFFKNIAWEGVDKENLLEILPRLKRYLDFQRFSAGFLIDSLGLKRTKIGDAMVSNKNANFIINLNEAKAEHVVMLAGLIKERVEHKYGIRLKEEIQCVGF